MKEEIEYTFEKLNNAFGKLKEGVEDASSELEKDGVIQRFEFTFELFWKTLRIFLREHGIETNTPRGSLEEAFRIGWLGEEKPFLDMLEDRNKSSHIYKKEIADEIFQRIKNSYIKAIDGVLNKLETEK